MTLEALVEAGVIRRVKDGVRMLADGELKAKLAFDVAGASKAAIEKIEKAGGSVKLPARQRRVTHCTQAAVERLTKRRSTDSERPEPISWLRQTAACSGIERDQAENLHGVGC